jgi:ribosomal protein S7
MIDQQPLDMTDTGRVISAMMEDIKREAKGEIIESQDAMKAIGKRTARLLKQTFVDALKENANERV